MEVGLKEVLITVNTLVLPVAFYIARTVNEIRREVRKLNGRQIRLETWREVFEKDCDARHRELGELRSKVLGGQR